MGRGKQRHVVRKHRPVAHGDRARVHVEQGVGDLHALPERDSRLWVRRADVERVARHGISHQVSERAVGQAMRQRALDPPDHLPAAPR